VVIILSRGTSLKDFTDLIACFLMCFVCVSTKAGIVHVFLVYSATESGLSFSERLCVRTFTLVPEKVDSLCFRKIKIPERCSNSLMLMVIREHHNGKIIKKTHLFPTKLDRYSRYGVRGPARYFDAGKAFSERSYVTCSTAFRRWTCTVLLCRFNNVVLIHLEFT
jgi:hypothetical protein